jgi:aldose 1-epimerase
MQLMKISSLVPAVLLLIVPAARVFAQSPRIEKQSFGKTADGTEVFLYTLKNASGMQVKITNFGGRITTVEVPDRNKKFDDVVLGFDNVEGYTSGAAAGAYFGAIIGRYANRLAHGTFTLDGHTYHIPTNEGANMLHGGKIGFDKKVWHAKEISVHGLPALELHYLSPDGQEGFPGNLNVTVRYSLDNKDGLHLDYTATTDKPTVLNLTNHSYFNLEGAGSQTILNERLTIDADRYTPIDSTLIPTGAIDSVAGTPLDFRKATEIGSRINDNNEQLKLAKGYDFNFVLNHPGDLAKVAVKVEDPKSGRVMEVFTTQPGVQFYTGNFLNGSVHGIGGTYGHRSALCLETQHFPDSPNHSNFPSTVLRPGQTFRSTTIYRFSTE